MSQEQQPQEQNGHAKPRTEVRQDVLELNNKRNKIESEIKEYQEILQSVSWQLFCFEFFSLR